MPNIEELIEKLLDIFNRVRTIEKKQREHEKILFDFLDKARKMHVEELRKNYLTQQELEKFLGLSSRWIREQRRLGNIGWVEVSPHVFMYPRDEVEKFLIERTIKRLNHKK